MIKVFLKRVLISPFTLIVLVPFILVIFWFKEGNIMGTAESGLPFYNFQIAYNSNKDAWNHYALGFPTNIGMAAKPTYWLLAQLQNIGVPGFILQASFFWLVLVVSGLSIYLVTKSLFPELKEKFLLIAVLFYWLNPFSLVNIWNRFLNNFFVFYAFLPLVMLIFIIGIKTKKFKNAIYLGLASVIFSYSLTSLAFVLIFWFVLIFIFLFYLFIIKETDKKFLIKYFLLCIIFWIFINFWWIGQVFTYLSLGSFKAVISTAFTENGNYLTFSALSQNLGDLTYLLRLKHGTFFQDVEKIPYVEIYLSPIIIILEFFISGLLLLPIITKKRNGSVLLLGSFFILSIFLAKGNNPPFGEIFDWFFKNFAYLQLFRNPFEKFGFLLPLAAAPLFALGVNELCNVFKEWKKYVYVLIFFWITIVWGFPFWSSLVFTGTEAPTNKGDIGYQVKVPQAYQQANDWLSSKGQDFKLLVLPISEEGITYTWQKGYSGVELSNQLFVKSSVSFVTNIPYYDEVAKNIERLFFQRDDFYKILEVLNIKYIIVRKDIDWRNRQIRDPQKIISRLDYLETKGKIAKVAEFGDLSIWEISSRQNKIIYVTNKLINTYGISRLDDILNSDIEQPVVIGSINKAANSVVSSEIIYPSYKFQSVKKITISDTKFRDDLIFPTIKYLPDSKIYPLILFKEKIETFFIRDKETILMKQISLLGKRLVEVEKEAERGNFLLVKIALNNYLEQLKEVEEYLLGDKPFIGVGYITQEDLYRVFFKHFDKINKIKSLFNSDQKTILNNFELTLKTVLVNKGILPYFDYLENENDPTTNKSIYQFKIEKEDSYEFLLNLNSIEKYYKITLSTPLILQVDNELISRVGMNKDNGKVSFGFFNFTKGIHEISWNMPEAINLLEDSSEVSLAVDHGITEKSIKVNNFDPFSKYFLNLNYFIKRGNGVEIRVEQNIDRIKKDSIEARYSKMLTPDNYFFDTKSFGAYIVPSSSADDIRFILRVVPWNNCETIHKFQERKKCLNPDFRRLYDQTTEVSVDKISLSKLVTEIPILKRFANNNQSSIPEITLTKINNAEYKVNIHNATSQYILILSELFDLGWRLYTDDGKQLNAEHFIANTFANGWIIDKTGNYELKLEFVPQRVLLKGELISALVVISSLFLLISKIKK